MITKAYAGYSLREKERMNSSSGGIYPLIAETVLSIGGVVFAACYDALNVMHKKIDSIEDLSSSQGSKYVASDLKDTMRQVEQCLKEGVYVLFVGMPCQCAGLKSYLEIRKVDQAKLLIIDFICHGAPSRMAWNAYKKSLNDRGRELIFVNMRDKTTGWSNGDYAWYEKTSDGKVIVTPRRKAPYMQGTLANLYTRPSCFECAFKGVERCTDITIGDYWGVGSHLPEMDDNKGTSLILIHTDKGIQTFNAIKESIRWAEGSIDEAIKKNLCLVQSTTRNEKSYEFYKRLNSGEDFIQIINDLLKVSMMSKIKNKMKYLITHMGGVELDLTSSFSTVDCGSCEQYNTDSMEVAA